ncbi:hypothetical protein [Neorhizobium sp. DT-125]|uniref:hypothetical protein n=1 Tax=Neorhizobium sp. DT-125 TaxID=3396163 RepID=UPI003F1C4417
MSHLSSQTRSKLLGETIRDAIRFETAFDPDPFAGLSLPDAYGVQAEVFHALDQPFKGSKLTLKGDVCHSAPLFWVAEGDRHAFRPGVSLEVELAFVLGKDIATGSGPVTRLDVVDAIASVHIGVEFLRSRYAGGSRRDPALAAADMMSNAGYILGPLLHRQLLDEGASIGPLSIAIDGQAVFDKPATHVDGDPLKTVTVLANQAPLSSFSMLKAGQVLTTGSLCGLIPIGEPARVDVNMAGQQFVLSLS